VKLRQAASLRLKWLSARDGKSDNMKTRVLFVLALFLFAVAGCSVFRAESRLASAAPAAATPAPLVITVVVTPTPGPVAVETIDADRIEAGRIAVYERVAPAVVNVTTQVLRSSFFRGAIPEEGSGSGFLWDAQGHIVTNNHVVEGAEKINVRLTDGTEMHAKIVGRDPATDVALIKVDGKGPFSYLSLGDSDSLRVGEWVMAVGNPLAMEHTVTVGVVSAKGRRIGVSPDPNASSFEDFIQTDAAINLGNSGGPLVNVRAEVVGMNTAINAGGQNLGFAIPVNTIKMVLPQLKEKGKVVRGYIGVQITDVDQKAQESFKLASREGALVQSVTAGGPADKAGIKAGDVIVAVGGTSVKDTRTLIYRVSALPPGQKVELEVIREGKRPTVTVTLGERPSNGDEQETSTAKEDTPVSKLGVQVDDLTQRTRRQFEIPREIEGVVVTDVTDLSPADDANLRPGDVVMRVNEVDVTSEREFKDSVSSVRPGSMVRFYVYRSQGDVKTFVFLRMP
jgi:serine protease Do